MSRATLETPPQPTPVTRGYQYQHGDRPLEDYTIQRGAGRGGFGEVYYALSDSGREVALKLIQTYEQIELRGISQCMNLKSPHLVTIFDVKYGQDGRPWVIMEYVSGPSLRQLLDAAPSGLGAQKAAFFLREIGKGLTYLHDCGIVHRDLKPGNIFYENGYVKIGDYGLSKAIATTQHSGQTVTVGTVHYMAPEIGAGKYDKSIDIYALGALLYEMLTGQVPFFGASPAEVLMKHLSSDVDVSGIEEPFRSVIRKAMAKNPADRYQSVQEMVEAVFGAEHVRNSVSHFSPDSLTIVAGHAAQRIPPSGGSFVPSDAPAPAGQGDYWQRAACMWGRFGKRFGPQMGGRFAGENPGSAPQPAQAGPPDPFGRGVADPLALSQRLILGIIAGAAIAIVAGILGAGAGDPPVGFFTLTGAAAATVALVLVWRRIAPALQHESPWMTRLALAGGGGVAAAIFTLPYWAHPHHHPRLAPLAIFASFLVLNLPARLWSGRRERVSIKNMIFAGLVAFVAAAVCDVSPELTIGVVVAATIAAGLIVPWSPAAVGSPASARGSGFVPPPAVPPPLPQGGPVPFQPVAPAPAPSPTAVPRPVARWVRIVWLVLFIGLATLGLTLWLSLAAGAFGNREDSAMAFAFGTGALLDAVFCLRRSRHTGWTGFWEYLLRPVIQLACMQSMLIAICMGTAVGPQSGDMPAVIFFIVFPAIVLFVVTFIARPGGVMSQTYNHQHSVRLPPSGEPLTLFGAVLGLGRFATAMIGYAVLAFALLVALAVVTNLPGLFASGALDPRMPDELRESFGMERWPDFLRHIGAVISIVTALVAMALLLLSRRRWGGLHMFRLVCGVVVLFAMVASLGRALPDWGIVERASTPPAAMEQYFQMVHAHGLFSAAALFVLAMFLLLWPPRRHQSNRQELPPPAPAPAAVQPNN